MLCVGRGFVAAPVFLPSGIQRGERLAAKLT
jgi:hypothetical protein